MRLGSGLPLANSSPPSSPTGVLGVVAGVSRGCRSSLHCKLHAQRIELDDAPEVDEGRKVPLPKAQRDPRALDEDRPHQDDVGVAWARLRRSTAQSARLAETYTLSKVARQIIQANSSPL